VKVNTKAIFFMLDGGIGSLTLISFWIRYRVLK